MTSMHVPIAGRIGRISGSITEPSCRFLCREIIHRPQWYQSAWGDDKMCLKIISEREKSDFQTPEMLNSCISAIHQTL
jgi:hypothetical protein